jgi:hypothetical protein
MASIAIIWTIGAAIVAGCCARALAMRAAADHFSELKWYTIAGCALLMVCVLWASLEPNAVPQQRIIIAIVGAIAGALILMFVTEYVRPRALSSASLPPMILQAQIKTIEEFQSFLDGKDESELQDIFDIKNIIRYNTLIYRQPLDPSMPKALSDAASGYFKDGPVRIDTTKANLTHRPSGMPDIHVIPNRVALINLSKKNVDARAKLYYFYNSTELSSDIKDSIKSIDDAVDKDLSNVIDILDLFMSTNPQAIIHDDDSGSPLFGSVN